MRVKLTAKSVENVKPPEKGRLQLWDSALPAFGLRITERGKKSWVVMYRYRDRQRRMTLGSYPAFSLAEAREEARATLRAVERGEDPAAEKKEAKRKPPTLFADSVEEFIELYAKPKNRGWAESRRLLMNNVAPHFKYMTIHDVTRHHVIDVLDGIIARGAPTQANRTLAAIRKLYNWSMDRGLIDHNPVLGLKPPVKETSRDRVLTDPEVRKVWAVWEEMEWPFGPLFKLLLLTGQRRSEVASMKWSDIDFENNIWTIPREIAKNDRTHDVPLSSLILEIINSVPQIAGRDLLFSTTRRTPVSGFGKLKRQIDETSGVENWRLHDLRRTAASGMARLGVAPHVVEKILNHSSGTISGVAAIYNRHGYEKEKKQALETWSKYLIELFSTTPQSKGAEVDLRKNANNRCGWTTGDTAR
jgi:integrase